MNDNVLKLVMAVIDSDLPKSTREEIVRFYTLPRIVTAIPKIEENEDSKEFGTIKRPTAEDEKRKQNPKLAEEEDEMRKVLS